MFPTSVPAEVRRVSVKQDMYTKKVKYEEQHNNNNNNGTRREKRSKKHKSEPKQQQDMRICLFSVFTGKLIPKPPQFWRYNVQCIICVQNSKVFCSLSIESVMQLVCR